MFFGVLNNPRGLIAQELLHYLEYVIAHGGNFDDAKICKGNPHNCVKTLYHKGASKRNKQINDGVFKNR